MEAGKRWSDGCSAQVYLSYLLFCGTHAYKWRYLALVAQMVKRLPTMLEIQVQSLGWEDPLEEEMATHSSTLAWKIPWTEEPGRLQSMGSQRVGHDWATSLHLALSKGRVFDPLTSKDCSLDTYADPVLGSVAPTSLSQLKLVKSWL